MHVVSRMWPCCVVALISCAIAAAQGGPIRPAQGWTAAPLPLSRARLEQALGLDASLPRGLLLAAAVRRLHESDLEGDGRRARVRSLLSAEAAAAEPLEVAIPGDMRGWRRVLPSVEDPASLVRAILSDPQVGLLYLALAQLDPETRDAVLSDPDLLAVFRTGPGVAAGIASAWRIRDGRVITPGGEGTRAAWEAAVGGPGASTAAFAAALFTAQAGRVAQAWAALGTLPPPVVQFALGLERSAHASPETVARLVRVLAPGESSWRFADRPFARVSFDAGLVLLALDVGDDGRLRGPRSRGFWRAVLDDGDLGAGGDPDDIDAVSLLELATLPDWAAQRHALQMIAFTQRLFPDCEASACDDAVRVTRALPTLPALLFTLERMGVRDASLLATAVARARAAGARGSPADRRTRLSHLQGALALVDRLRTSGSIDDRGAGALVGSLFSAAPGVADSGRTTAAWIRGTLLPSLAAAPEESAGATSAERVLLRALAGRVSDGGAQRIEWESAWYRVDLAAAEYARLEHARERQGGPSLDAALAVIEAAQAAERRGVTADAVRASVDAAAAATSKVRPDGETDADTRWPSQIAALRAGLRTASGRGRAVRGLRRAGDEMLAHALRALAYAPYLGDPDGQVFLAGDVSQRHDFGIGLPPVVARTLHAWMIPVERSASSRPWHLGGSLLGVEIALGRLALRRPLGEMPGREPLLNESLRRAFVAGLVLTRPTDLGDGTRGAIVEAIDRGRARLAAMATASSSEIDRQLADAGVGPLRRGAVLWSLARDPAGVEHLLSLTELSRLGRLDVQAAALAPWGAAQMPFDGSLLLRFPPPAPPEQLAGRPATGVVATRLLDLKLHVAERMARLGVPSALLPSVMAAALQSFLDESAPAHADDWFALVGPARSATPARIEDFVSALAAPGGPLAPEPPSSGRESRP